jgi:hypothetical protein
MLQFEHTDNDKRRIDVFYVVHDRAHAAYDDELEGPSRARWTASPIACGSAVRRVASRPRTSLAATIYAIPPA